VSSGDLARVEEAALNALQTRRQLFYDGWLLRLSPGAAKRARSVNAHFGSTRPVGQKIAYCERLYAARDLPGRIVVAVDARDGMVATRGWADVSTLPVAELGLRFTDAGVAALLFTDVGRDGLLKGCNIPATTALARAVPIPVIASGGVAGIADIEQLAAHAADGIEGVITGRALYDGRLDLAAALAVARR